MTNAIYRNLPNIVSILGVLPVFLLLIEGGYHYLVPLMVYNNLMDDLDGILASKLNLRSQFGSVLDNVCDAVAHTVFVMAIGLHFGNGGTAVSLAATVATAAILLRIVSRLTIPSPGGRGSPTNELIRHVLLLLVLANVFGFDPDLFLIVLFILHAVSMLAPFPMPHLIRNLSKSATAVFLVNVSLVVAWQVPMATPVVAAAFMGTYLYTFLAGGQRWLRK